MIAIAGMDANAAKLPHTANTAKLATLAPKLAVRHVGSGP
jgi:hypothetical protein